MRYRSISLILFVLAAIFDCKSARDVGAKASSPAWTEKIRYSHEGTRSEARSYYLFYGDKALPDLFDQVMAGGKVYFFASRSEIWGDDGYLLTTDKLDLPVGGTFTEEDAAQGWYYFPFLKEGTPAGWIYAKRGDLQLFIDPERMDDSLTGFGLEPLPRSTALMDTLVPDLE